MFEYGFLINLAPLTDGATRELAKEIFQRVEDFPSRSSSYWSSALKVCRIMLGMV